MGGKNLSPVFFCQGDGRWILNLQEDLKEQPPAPICL